MGWLERIRGLFGTKNLFDLSVKELDDKILEIKTEEDRIINELKYIDSEMDRLIIRLKSTTKDYERRSIEMDLQNLANKYKVLENQLNELISVRNALHNIMLIKSREDYLKKHDLWDMILKLDINELEWLLVGKRLTEEELVLKLNELRKITDRAIKESPSIDVGGRINVDASPEDIKRQLLGK
jgi:hypothetical protein